MDITKEKEVNPVKRVKPEIHTVTSDNLSKAPKTLWRRVLEFTKTNTTLPKVRASFEKDRNSTS